MPGGKALPAQSRSVDFNTWSVCLVCSINNTLHSSFSPQDSKHFTDIKAVTHTRSLCRSTSPTLLVEMKVQRSRVIWPQVTWPFCDRAENRDQVSSPAALATKPSFIMIRIHLVFWNWFQILVSSHARMPHMHCLGMNTHESLLDEKASCHN